VRFKRLLRGGELGSYTGITGSATVDGGLAIVVGWKEWKSA